MSIHIEEIERELRECPTLGVIIDRQQQRVNFLCSATKQIKVSLREALALIKRGVVPSPFAETISSTAEQIGCR